MQVLNKITSMLLEIEALAGMRVTEDNDIIIIVPRTVMQYIMYETRDFYQHNFVVKKDDKSRSSFGIRFNGILFMTKEDYNARIL